MIVLTRLNGTRFAINDEQIERLDEAPNTIVVLVNGNRYTALESMDEIIDAIVDFRSRVLDATETGDNTGRARTRKEASISIFRAPAHPDGEAHSEEVSEDGTIADSAANGWFHGRKTQD